MRRFISPAENFQGVKSGERSHADSAPAPSAAAAAPAEGWPSGDKKKKARLLSALARAHTKPARHKTALCLQWDGAGASRSAASQRPHKAGLTRDSRRPRATGPQALRSPWFAGMEPRGWPRTAPKPFQGCSVQSQGRGREGWWRRDGASSGDPAPRAQRRSHTLQTTLVVGMLRATPQAHQQTSNPAAPRMLRPRDAARPRVPALALQLRGLRAPHRPNALT